jgi:3-mercaptopyruvate sulfurtransferase SseA
VLSTLSSEHVPSSSNANAKEDLRMTEYANPDVLVSTDWLEAQLDDPDVRVIEVDEDTTAYEKGHIRGAVGWNWTTDLHTPVGRDYLDQGGFAELLSVAGGGRRWSSTAATTTGSRRTPTGS